MGAGQKFGILVMSDMVLDCIEEDVERGFGVINLDLAFLVIACQMHTGIEPVTCIRGFQPTACF